MVYPLYYPLILSPFIKLKIELKKQHLVKFNVYINNFEKSKLIKLKKKLEKLKRLVSLRYVRFLN